MSPEASKDSAIAAVLKRAALARTARVAKQRLALAAYKAQNGLQSSTLEQIEARTAEPARKRKPSGLDDLEPATKRPHVAQSSQGAPTPNSDSSHPFPPSMSLYDAMMTPNLNSVYGSFSPRLAEPFAETASPPRLKNIITTDPLGGLQHPLSPVSSARDEMPFHRPDSPLGKRRTGTPLHRRTGSLPANSRLAAQEAQTASRNTKEFVQAASALQSLTSGPSEEAVVAPSAIPGASTPPPAPGDGEKKSPRSTSAPAFGGSRSKSSMGGEERETAAELMLYLASSPSPKQKKTMDALGPQAEDGTMIKGRKLFAEEDEPLSAAPQQPPLPHRLQPSPLEPLQPQKMPQTPLFLPQQQQTPFPTDSKQAPPTQTSQLASSLPPFSTAESYTTHGHAAPNPPLFYSHPSSLQPSFAMGSLHTGQSFPISPFGLPASAPADLKGDGGLYYAQPGPPNQPPMQPGHAPRPYGMPLYGQYPVPSYQQFGQSW